MLFTVYLIPRYFIWFTHCSSSPCKESAAEGVGVLMAIALVLSVLIFRPRSEHVFPMVFKALCILGPLFGPLPTIQISSANMNSSIPCGSCNCVMFSIRILEKKGLSIPPCGVPFSNG